MASHFDQAKAHAIGCCGEFSAQDERNHHAREFLRAVAAELDITVGDDAAEISTGPGYETVLDSPALKVRLALPLGDEHPRLVSYGLVPMTDAFRIVSESNTHSNVALDYAIESPLTWAGWIGTLTRIQRKAWDDSLIKTDKFSRRTR